MKHQLILLLFLLIACTSQQSNDTDRLKDLDNLTAYPSDTKPKSNIEFFKEESYGSTAKKYVTVGGSVGNVIVVDKAERVFIADDQRVHVYQSDGQYITHLGREGKGPGEFISLGEMKIGPDNLYVHDSLQLKIHVFALDSLQFSHTINLNPQKWADFSDLKGKKPSNFYIRSDSLLLLKFTPGIQQIEKKEGGYTHSYYSLNSKNGSISKKVFEQKVSPPEFISFKGEKFSAKFSFQGGPLIAVSNNGRFYSAWTTNFLIKEHNPKGAYLRAFYYPYERVPLNRDRLIRKHDIGYETPNLNLIRKMELPEKWPVLHRMMTDANGRLWIATIVEDTEVYQWWVLNGQGELLARFNWPKDQPIEAIKNGGIYVRETDEETGERKIVRHRFEMD